MEHTQQHSAGTTVGDRLKAAREAAGLSIAEIAQRTRVNGRHLAAIERGDHDALPAAPYSIGFVKAFARTVGLESEAVAAQFRREWDREAFTPVEAVRYEPSDPSRMPSRMLAWTAALVALVIMSAYGVWRSGMFTGQTAEDRARIAAAAPAADTAAPTPAPAPQAPAAPAAAPRGPVLLTAIEPAWIRVYEREGATLFQGELAQGQSYEVPAAAADPLIRLGRAEAVRVSVGGREVAPLGPPARTVKDVSLKADALLARAAPDAPGATPPSSAAPASSPAAP